MVHLWMIGISRFVLSLIFQTSSNPSYPGHDTLSIYMRHVEIDYYTDYLAPSSVFNNSYFVEIF